MKRILFILIFIFNLFISFAQDIHPYNYIIDMNYYKAYYSEQIQTSSFVIYKLYNGGGLTSRKGLNFKSYKSLPHYDYTKSGYDRGHLVPAEDMAYSQPSLKSTFYYINCIPQHPSLNRGTWRRYENMIRNASNSDSLIIVVGGCDYVGLIPQKCFKIAYSLSTKKCLYTILISNDSKMIITTDDKLKQKFPFKKIINLYNGR